LNLAQEDVLPKKTRHNRLTFLASFQKKPGQFLHYMQTAHI
jgi:hypothetical protein